MIDKRTLRRLTVYVLGASAILTALGFVVGGAELGFGALAGAIFGSLNWIAMRYVAERLMVASAKGKAVWGTLLVVKMTLTLGVTWGVLATGVVDPIGFAIGLSGLVLGLLAGAMHLALSTSGEAASTEES
jgi:hypothetical protein